MHRKEQIISLIKATSHAIMNVHTKIFLLPHEEMYNCVVMKIVNLLIATRSTVWLKIIFLVIAIFWHSCFHSLQQ